MSKQMIIPNATWWNYQHDAIKRIVKVAMNAVANAIAHADCSKSEND